MADRIGEDKIDQIRQAVDIVEVISDYVQLKKQGEITSVYALSTVKAPHHFQYRLTNKFFIVLAAERVEMFFPF